MASHAEGPSPGMWALPNFIFLLYKCHNIVGASYTVVKEHDGTNMKMTRTTAVTAFQIMPLNTTQSQQIGYSHLVRWSGSETTHGCDIYRLCKVALLRSGLYRPSLLGPEEARESLSGGHGDSSDMHEGKSHLTWLDGRKCAPKSPTEQCVLLSLSKCV